jgi:hypothetical protein
MRRLPRWSLIVASLVAAVVALVLIGVSWKGRADDICREKAPRTQSSYTIAWKWNEFAYVCDYRAPSEPVRRVGVIDAFHSDGRKRH